MKLKVDPPNPFFFFRNDLDHLVHGVQEQLIEVYEPYNQGRMLFVSRIRIQLKRVVTILFEEYLWHI
jgi:hypothetical protein